MKYLILVSCALLFSSCQAETSDVETALKIKNEHPIICLEFCNEKIDSDISTREKIYFHMIRLEVLEGLGFEDTADIERNFLIWFLVQHPEYQDIDLNMGPTAPEMPEQPKGANGPTQPIHKE